MKSPTPIFTPYRFQSNDVRTMSDDNGDVWFVAKDVCDVLGIENSRDAVSNLDDDEKNTVGVSDGIQRGNPNHTIISESGLYSIIFRSNKPEAKIFRKWVTSDVLPRIRKTGSYAIHPEPPKIEEPCKPFSEREKLAVLFFRNVDRLFDDLCEISQILVERGDMPASLLLTCMNVVSQADVCRDIAQLFLKGQKK